MNWTEELFNQARLLDVSKMDVRQLMDAAQQMGIDPSRLNIPQFKSDILKLQGMDPSKFVFDTSDAGKLAIQNSGASPNMPLMNRQLSDFATPVKNWLSDLFGTEKTGPTEIKTGAGANVIDGKLNNVTVDNSFLGKDTILGGMTLGELGSIAKTGFDVFSAFNSYKNAKNVFNLQKDAFNTSKAIAIQNMDNSIKAYNTGLQDKLRARGYYESKNTSKFNDYYEKNKLKNNL